MTSTGRKILRAALPAIGFCAVQGACQANTDAPGQHKKDLQAFVGTWRVTKNVTTSACQDEFLLEHVDPSTLTLFHLALGETSDLASNDGDCSFNWHVNGKHMTADAGQFCNQDLGDGAGVEVGLIHAQGTVQPDGSAKDSILVSVTLRPATGTPRTCLVTIEEALTRIPEGEVSKAEPQAKARAVRSSTKYARPLMRK